LEYLLPFSRYTFKTRKWLVFLPLSLFDATARVNRLEFLDETYSAKSKGMGLDTHSTSLTQPTQIFTFAHSIVKHTGRRVASGDKKITDCIGFFGYFWSVFGIFRFLKYRSRYRCRFLKISDIGSVRFFG